MNGGNWLELNPCRYFRANPVPQWLLSGPVQNNTTTSLAYSTQVPVQLTGYTSNSVLLVRHTFDGLGDEQVAWDTWHDSETGKRCLEEWDDYVEGPPTFHRYNVLHSY